MSGLINELGKEMIIESLRGLLISFSKEDLKDFKKSVEDFKVKTLEKLPEDYTVILFRSGESVSIVLVKIDEVELKSNDPLQVDLFEMIDEVLEGV